MGAYFNATPDRINLTLTAFMIFYALGTLIWGPLSDHFGRKPILLAGLSLYVVSSALCAFTWNVEGLILSRIFQALGGSAAGVVATAIVKDVYSGRKRGSVLAIVQSMVLISPAIAPVIGALLLKIISWRGVFCSLTGIGVVALVGSFLFTETISERTTEMLLPSLGRLGKVLQNRGFTLLLLLFSLGAVSTFAFIASSTYIYQNDFNLSGQVYSLYFSVNALGLIAGPMIFLWFSRRLHTERIILGCYVATLISGVLVYFWGSREPWIFALCILPASIAGSCLRPGSANMMLEQQKGDTGSVSSLMGCTGLLMGALGLQVISMPWSSTIMALGVMTFSTAAIALIAWPFVIKRTVRLPGPNAQNP